MPITYPNTIKQARSQVVIDSVSSKTIAAATGTGAAPSLVIGTSALSGSTGVLATIPMAIAWATTDAAGVITLNNLPLTVNASATGTAAKAEIRRNDGTVMGATLTVGTSASDITVNTTTFTSGGQVQVTAGTITPAA